MKNPIYLIFLFIILPNSLFSQESNHLMYKGNNNIDNQDLISAFQNGKVHGHFRYFFMATQNESILSDYYANAGGGGIRYETQKFKGFSFAVSGFYIFNLGSSNLSKLDSFSQTKNRYEIALFDLEDPNNHKDLDRLEEFFIRYQFQKIKITWGRQLINNPFINLQDGRMRPTGAEGIVVESDSIKNFNFQIGWIYAFSPRSTVKWFDTHESIGIYSMGKSRNSEKSDYHHHLPNSDVFILGLSFHPSRELKMNFSNLYMPHLFNTSFIENQLLLFQNQKLKIYNDIQIFRQFSLVRNEGLNSQYYYIEPHENSWVFGSRIRLELNDIKFSLNYNAIRGNGRYLMPREWGRETFYATMPRERLEGTGKSDGIMINIEKKFKNKSWKSKLGIGYYKIPDSKSSAFNKYQLNSFSQLNTDVYYDFKGKLKGLEAHLLFAAKKSTLGRDLSYEEKINKLNMINYNLILNYHF